MRTHTRVLLLLTVVACVSACGGCAGDVAANNEADRTKENLQPPPLQPASAPAIRSSNPAPAPQALKPSPSAPPAAAKPESPRTETRERPRDSGNLVAQGPIRSEGVKDDRSNRGGEGRERDRNRDNDKRGNGGERRTFGPRPPGGDGERRNGDDGPRMLRPTEGGRGDRAEIMAGGGFGGLGGDSARKFKSPPLPDGIPSWFKDNDKDGDGQVALFEWPDEDFNKYDRNGDGFITIAEAMRFAPKAVTPPGGAVAGSPTTPAAPSTPPTTPAAPGMTDDQTRQIARGILERYDRNRDNKLDQQEIQNTTRLRMSWQQYDANKDNIIDLDEMVAFTKGLNAGGGGGSFTITGGPGGGFGGFGGFGGGGGRDGGRGGPDGGRGGGRGPGGGGGNDEERTKQFIGRFDTNRDGKLSREEFPRFFGGPERFDQIDTNRDGAIDVQEWMKSAETMMRGMRRPGG